MLSILFHYCNICVKFEINDISLFTMKNDSDGVYISKNILMHNAYIIVLLSVVYFFLNNEKFELILAKNKLQNIIIIIFHINKKECCFFFNT
jgi:hypothetical protein